MLPKTGPNFLRWATPSLAAYDKLNETTQLQLNETWATYTSIAETKYLEWNKNQTPFSCQPSRTFRLHHIHIYTFRHIVNDHTHVKPFSFARLSTEFQDGILVYESGNQLICLLVSACYLNIWLRWSNHWNLRAHSSIQFLYSRLQVRGAYLRGARHPFRLPGRPFH